MRSSQQARCMSDEVEYTLIRLTRDSPRPPICQGPVASRRPYYGDTDYADDRGHHKPLQGAHP